MLAGDLFHNDLGLQLTAQQAEDSAAAGRNQRTFRQDLQDGQDGREAVTMVEQPPGGSVPRRPCQSSPPKDCCWLVLSSFVCMVPFCAKPFSSPFRVLQAAKVFAQEEKACRAAGLEWRLPNRRPWVMLQALFGMLA